MKDDSRYPYTYAVDYLRSAAGYGPEGTLLSRSDASQVSKAVAAAIGVPDKELACKLADYYLKNLDAITERSVIQAMASMRLGDAK